RADETLDVTAEARLTRGTPLDRDTGILAPSLKGAAAEVGTVVDMHRFWQAGDGPRLSDLAFSQPCGFVEDGVQQAQAGGQPGRSVHGQIESGHHAAADVHRE